MRCRCEHNEDEAAVLLLLLVERLPSDWYLNQLKGGRVECDALLLLFRARHPQLFSVDVISSAGVNSPLHLALSVAGARGCSACGWACCPSTAWRWHGTCC